MNQAQPITRQRQYRSGVGGALRMEQQLIREISCLKRQLERLRLRPDLLDAVTIKTYEEMILSREAALQNLEQQGA